jgi:hypothetical protein
VRSGRITCALLCAGALLSSGRIVAQQAAPTLADTAYHQGRKVRFTPAETKSGHSLVVANEILGPVLENSKPSNHRLNLYVVAQRYEDFDGLDASSVSLILNEVPEKDEPVQWDVYWAVVLDPALQTEFTSESELLIELQKEFRAGASVTFDQIPGAYPLREFLHIDSLTGLDRFRLPSGNLPRVVIVPAGMVLRASAGEMSVQSAKNK